VRSTTYIHPDAATHKIAVKPDATANYSRSVQPLPSASARDDGKMSPIQKAPPAPFQMQEQGGGMHFQIGARS